MTIAPSLFISHGSPMFAVLPGELGSRLGVLGARLQDVRAIAVVSPHWQTRGVRVAMNARPGTIHDFGGFPPALYQLQYPVEGAPDVATDAAHLLVGAGFDVALDPGRGLDHGAWVPLRHLLPQANIPAFQVSMPFDLDVAGALRLGAALAPLRDERAQRPCLIITTWPLRRHRGALPAAALNPDGVAQPRHRHHHSGPE